MDEVLIDILCWGAVPGLFYLAGVATGLLLGSADAEIESGLALAPREAENARLRAEAAAALGGLRSLAEGGPATRLHHTLAEWERLGNDPPPSDCGNCHPGRLG